MAASNDEFIHQENHDHSANDRENEAGRVKECAILRLGKEPVDESSDKRARNADQRGIKKAQEGSNKETDDQDDDRTNDNGPDYMEHVVFLSWLDLLRSKIGQVRRSAIFYLEN